MDANTQRIIDSLAALAYSHPHFGVLAGNAIQELQRLSVPPVTGGSPNFTEEARLRRELSDVDDLLREIARLATEPDDDEAHTLGVIFAKIDARLQLLLDTTPAQGGAL